MLRSKYLGLHPPVPCGTAVSLFLAGFIGCGGSGVAPFQGTSRSMAARLNMPTLCFSRMVRRGFPLAAPMLMGGTNLRTSAVIRGYRR